MSKILILSRLVKVLFSLMPVILFAQNQLDIAGHTKIIGNIDLSHHQDTRSMFVGHATPISYFNAVGRNNTIVGIHSSVNPQSGDNAGTQNSFFGYDSGLFNCGSRNAFYGMMSGSINQGISNCFFGYTSGNKNTFGGGNAFYGHRSGFNNAAGSQNSFFGFQAGSANVDGGMNVFLGANAGSKNTAGGKNTFLGVQADQLNNGGDAHSSNCLGI